MNAKIVEVQENLSEDIGNKIEGLHSNVADVNKLFVDFLKSLETKDPNILRRSDRNDIVPLLPEELKALGSRLNEMIAVLEQLASSITDPDTGFRVRGGEVLESLQSLAERIEEFKFGVNPNSSSNKALAEKIVEKIEESLVNFMTRRMDDIISKLDKVVKATLPPAAEHGDDPAEVSMC